MDLSRAGRRFCCNMSVRETTEGLVNTRLLVAICLAVMSVVLVSGQPAQSAEPQATERAGVIQDLAGPEGPQATTPAELATHRAMLDQYCVGCHSQAAQAAGAVSAERLTLDDFDLASFAENRETGETMIRKLRAGLMPPVNARHPEPAAIESFIAWMETELDQTAATYLPAPGLHRMNRSEYSNAPTVSSTGVSPSSPPAGRHDTTPGAPSVCAARPATISRSTTWRCRSGTPRPRCSW